MARKQKHYDPSFYIGLLHPRLWGTWIAIFILFIFGLMPSFIRDPITRILAKLVLKIAKKPISVAKINIQQCFPALSPNEVDALISENVESFILVLFSQAELLFRSNAHIKRRVQLEGLEHIQQARADKHPIIFIMPHVWPIEYAGIRVNLELPMVTMVKAHRNELFNWFSNRIRSSQGGRVYMREAGIRALISELKQDNSFFYLPDEDLGPEQSVFAPFFATTKATLPVVGRLAKAGNAKVLPVKIGYDKQARVFKTTILPPLAADNMVSKEDESLVLNQIVEQVIKAYPEQYMWFLKILKTRPEGEPPIY
ncbi:lauroyl-Kdo(2)-lipid IV(A) myristoyltransferase [Shewanella gaetbuli]